MRKMKIWAHAFMASHYCHTEEYKHLEGDLHMVNHTPQILYFLYFNSYYNNNNSYFDLFENTSVMGE